MLLNFRAIFLCKIDFWLKCTLAQCFEVLVLNFRAQVFVYFWRARDKSWTLFKKVLLFRSSYCHTFTKHRHLWMTKDLLRSKRNSRIQKNHMRWAVSPSFKMTCSHYTSSQQIENLKIFPIFQTKDLKVWFLQKWKITLDLNNFVVKILLDLFNKYKTLVRWS